jgi:hypothetical protein
LLPARVKALPWRQVPADSSARDTGHGRIETRALKAAHVSGLDFPCARQAVKITRRRPRQPGHHPRRHQDAGYLHIPEGRRDHTTPAETLHLHGLD